jgi:hypothetical protein
VLRRLVPVVIRHAIVEVQLLPVQHQVESAHAARHTVRETEGNERTGGGWSLLSPGLLHPSRDVLRGRPQDGALCTTSTTGRHLLSTVAPLGQPRSRLKKVVAKMHAESRCSCQPRHARHWSTDQGGSISRLFCPYALRPTTAVLSAWSTASVYKFMMKRLGSAYTAHPPAPASAVGAKTICCWLDTSDGEWALPGSAGRVPSPPPPPLSAGCAGRVEAPLEGATWGGLKSYLGQCRVARTPRRADQWRVGEEGQRPWSAWHGDWSLSPPLTRL